MNVTREKTCYKSLHSFRVEKIYLLLSDAKLKKYDYLAQ